MSSFLQLKRTPICIVAALLLLVGAGIVFAAHPAHSPVQTSAYYARVTGTGATQGEACTNARIKAVSGALMQFAILQYDCMSNTGAIMQIQSGSLIYSLTGTGALETNTISTSLPTTAVCGCQTTGTGSTCTTYVKAGGICADPAVDFSPFTGTGTKFSLEYPAFGTGTTKQNACNASISLAKNTLSNNASTICAGMNRNLDIHSILFRGTGASVVWSSGSTLPTSLSLCNCIDSTSGLWSCYTRGELTTTGSTVRAYCVN